MHEIEGVVHHPIVATALEVVLQRREIRATARVRRDQFAIEDELVRRQARQLGGNRGKSIGPVEPRTGIERHVPVAQVSLDAVAVELQFMHEAAGACYLVALRGQARFDEARERRWFGTVKHAGEKARHRARTPGCYAGHGPARLPSVGAVRLAMGCCTDVSLLSSQRLSCRQPSPRLPPMRARRARSNTGMRRLRSMAVPRVSCGPAAMIRCNTARVGPRTARTAIRPRLIWNQERPRCGERYRFARSECPYPPITPRGAPRA